VKKITSGIDPSYIGPNTISWWNQVQLAQGSLENTKPFYS
jgi:hypothetical protein